MNHRSSVIAAAALAALTACQSTVDVPPARPFAFLDVNTVRNTSSPTGYVAVAQGIFTSARIAGIIGSADLTERCVSPAPIGTGLAYTDNPLDPGAVTMTLHGPVDTTTRTVTLKHNFLQSGDNWINDTYPQITPGSDSVTYTAAGVAGAFPPFTIRAATVAPFTAQSVDDSVTGSGIRVQWTPSPNPNTAMQISLQYHDSSTSTTGSVPNAEIVCIARDDGDFQINRIYLDEWQLAGTDSLQRARQVVFSRFLTTTGTSTSGDGIITVVVRRDTLIAKP